MRIQVDETRSVERVVCDRCKEQRDFIYGGGGTCLACGRDVCRNCSEYDDRDGGDYPPVYCKECWKIGVPFRARQCAAESAYEAAVEQAQGAWVLACARTTDAAMESRGG